MSEPKASDNEASAASGVVFLAVPLKFLTHSGKRAKSGSLPRSSRAIQQVPGLRYASISGAYSIFCRKKSIESTT